MSIIKHNFKQALNGKIIISFEDNYIDDKGEFFDIDLSSPKTIKISKIKNGPRWQELDIEVEEHLGSGSEDKPNVAVEGYCNCNCEDLNPGKHFKIKVKHFIELNSFTLTLKSVMKGDGGTPWNGDGGTTVTIGEP
jgi:hypothetical protein